MRAFFRTIAGRIGDPTCILTIGMVACMAALVACSPAPPRANVIADTTRTAEAALSRARSDPRLQGLDDNMKRARAVLIIAPGESSGVVIARDGKEGKWVGPAFYQVLRLDVGGGAMGFRAGETDLALVALAMSPKAVDWLVHPTVPGKGGLIVASGLDTATRASGGTGAPDMLLYDLGGARMPNFDGVLIAVDKAANAAYYARPVTPDDILLNNAASNPAAASLFEAAGR